MGWATIGAIAAKAIMTAVNIVERNPSGLKGNDKTQLALSLLQDIAPLTCQGTLPGVQHQTKEVLEAQQEFIKAYVKLQNAIAAANK